MARCSTVYILLPYGSAKVTIIYIAALEIEGVGSLFIGEFSGVNSLIILLSL